MLDSKTVKILEYLETFDFQEKVDLGDLITELFPFPKEEQEFNRVRITLINHLNAISKLEYTDKTGALIKPFAPDLSGINEWRNNPTKWFHSQFYVRITQDGLNAIHDHWNALDNRKLAQSALDVNESIVATNKSVIETNRTMVENGNAQIRVNQQIADNSDRQVGIMDEQKTLVEKQNTLYGFTLALTACNILVAIILCYVTIISNADKELISTQRSQLLEKQKEIKRLQLLKSDTVHYVLHYPQSKNKQIKK